MLNLLFTNFFTNLGEKKHESDKITFLLDVCSIRSYNILSAQAVTSANGDTIYITGGTLSGFENAGLLESTINGDTITSGVDVGKRINPNRVYALNEGQAYVQQKRD